MDLKKIDYDALKKRGILRAKKDGYFTLRTRMPAGNYNSEHLLKLSGIAQKYGKGALHVTTRQGIEIPHIKFEDIEKAEKEMLDAGIKTGTSGPRLRSTTTCPGNNWCKRGLIDTFSLFGRIENDLGIKCAMDLPHKFKISISGCPNRCTRADASEIGIHGQVDTSGSERRIGYAVYLGGCGGMTPHTAFKLDKIYTEEEALSLVGKVVDFYKKNAKPRQRLGAVIKEMGKSAFFEKIGL